jgi:hypothetical protein
MIGSRALRAGATLLVTAAALLPLSTLALDAWAGRSVALAVLLGACLAALLAAASLLLSAWSHDKREAVFLAALAGGFLGRMALFGVGIASVVLATHLPVTAFVAGLFSYYVLFQILEVRALQKIFGKRSSLPH